MIRGVAFCPHPPLLVPELAAGAAGELDGLRAACVAAITTVVRGGAHPVLIGSGAESSAHSPLSRGSLAGFGLAREFGLGSDACGGALDLPISLTVGAWLLRSALGPRSGALGFSVGPDFAASKAAVQLLALAETRDIALVVLGDGSARRSTSAPGYLDERAGPFDAALEHALRTGDAGALERLDEQRGAELLAAGVPAWRAAGRLLEGGAFDAELGYADAPYGVGYFVATWLARG